MIMYIDCQYTRQQILQMIVDERNRLNSCAQYHQDGGDPWLANHYELRAEAILDLMKVLGIEAYGEEKKA
jgi:hypothetical protein